MSRFAFHVEHAHPEQVVCFTVFLNNPFAIHQSEAAPLAQPQGFRVFGGFRDVHADGARIVYFLADDAGYVFDRKAASVIFHRYFHVFLCLTGVDSHDSSFGSIFPGIFGQCIYHEKSQGLVGFH